MPLGGILFEDVPFVEFMFTVFTRLPGKVQVCCCVPCMYSAITLFVDSSIKKQHVAIAAWKASCLAII